jgi:hypothetical protein
MTPAELRAHADREVADWPELTPEQLDRLASLLRPARRAA